MPAQMPSAKAALVALQAGQSPICIPIGRTTSRSNKTIRTESATFTNIRLLLVTL